MLVVGCVGWGIAAYLTYVHYKGLHPACFAHGGCEQVQSSRYAKLTGIPVATIGLVGYTLILCSLALRGELGRLAGVVLTLSGWGFSAYLTYRELFTIDAICQWCVGSAVAMTALVVLAAVRYVRAEP